MIGRGFAMPGGIKREAGVMICSWSSACLYIIPAFSDPSEIRRGNSYLERQRSQRRKRTCADGGEEKMRCRGNVRDK